MQGERKPMARFETMENFQIGEELLFWNNFIKLQQLFSQVLLKSKEVMQFCPM